MAQPIRKQAAMLIALVATTALGACATVPPPSPVSVTRFHQQDTLGQIGQIGQGIVFVESAPDESNADLELAPYKAAVAAELMALGYREGPRSEANAIASISLERFEAQRERQGGGPVSVGVGGRTGSFGSGVGLGIGINLGGGSNRARIGTELAVTLRPAGDQTSSPGNLWEGRAQIEVSQDTPEDQAASSAPILAKALFRDFPGGNGDTVTIELQDIETSE